MSHPLAVRLQAYEDGRDAMAEKVKEMLVVMFPLGTIVLAQPYGEANRKGHGEVVGHLGSTGEVMVKFFKPFEKTRGSRKIKIADVHWLRVEKWPVSTDEI